METLTRGNAQFRVVKYLDNATREERVMLLMTEQRVNRAGKAYTRRMSMSVDAWRLMEALKAENRTFELQHCAFCGDPLDLSDKDNRVRAEGTPKAGRTDCGRCNRGMRATNND